MVPKKNSKTSKLKRVFFSPLSLLDMEVEHRENRDIQRIREVSLLVSTASISSNMTKTSLVFFLSEFLSKTLRDVNENTQLFNFLFNSVQVLEYEEKSIANYHLVFLIKLTRFLGFYPNLEDYKEGDFFDLLNGVFVNQIPLHKHYVGQKESAGLFQLGRMNYANMHVFKFARAERMNLINRIMEYYRIHLHDFSAMKSLDILHELF